MKKKLSMLALAGLMMASPQAVTVLTSSKVSILDGKKENIVAYRDHESCGSWFWRPGSYKTTGHFEHSIVPKLVVAPHLSQAGNDNYIGFASQIEFEMEPDFNYQKNEAKLRSKISTYIKDHINSKAEEFKHCKPVAPNDIVLSVIPVKKISGKRVSKKKQNDVKKETFGGFKLSNDFGDSTVFSPLSHFWGQVFHDASAKNSQKLDEDWKNNLTGSKVGQLVYDIRGRELNVNSTYSFEGKFTAEFESSMKTLGCTTSSGSDNNEILGAAVGGLIGGPVGAFMGGSFFGGSSSETTTCTHQLTTNLINGSSNIKILFDHKKSDFKGKTKIVCNDDGECRTFALQQWVEYKMLEQLINFNLMSQVKEISDGVFDVTFTARDGSVFFNGKEGESAAAIDYKVQILQSSFDGISVAADVYKAHNDQLILDSYMYETKSFKCIQKKYFLQMIKHKSLIGKSLIPVDETCFDLEE